MADIKENGNEKKRRPGWIQALDLVLRIWHIGVTSVLFGGVVCGVSIVLLFTWHNLAIASGSALIISRICQSRHWLYQVRGIVALTHVGLLGIVHLHPEHAVPVLTVVLVLGVLSANLPGYIKQWSLVHRCRVE
ncbi:MAG: hypothetical protein WCA04_09995 [Geobacteraceae bacterium]